MENETEKKQYVWDHATIVEGYDATKYRKDPCGAWIAWDKYKDRHSPYGWEIDHIYPESRLKSIARESIDDNKNLRAMHWRNNASKGSDYPTYHAVVKADGNRNIDFDDTFEVNATAQTIIRNMYGV